MAQQRDEVGRSGIYPATGPLPEGDAEVITPGDINEGRTDPHRKNPPGVQHDEHLKDAAERMPRKGDELDEIGEKPTD